jgi:hypothetical protein
MTEPGTIAANTRRFWPALLFLFLAPAPLAEILSGNVPLFKFLTPPVPFFLSVVYGLPVVLIREFAAARRLTVPGIYLLGLAYGFLNEGIIAHTLTQQSGPPVGDFAGYGQVGLFQTGWAVMIVNWHALHSVLYPILLCHWLFPEAAAQRWLKPRAWKTAAVLLAALYPVYFGGTQQHSVAVFASYLGVTGGLAVLAAKFCSGASDGTNPAPLSLRPSLFGAGFLLLYLFQFACAKLCPFPVLPAVTIGAVTLLFRRAARTSWSASRFLLFGLGDDLAFASFTAVHSMRAGQFPVQAGIAGAAFLVIFVYLVRAVRQAPEGRRSRA